VYAKDSIRISADLMELVRTKLPETDL